MQVLKKAFVITNPMPEANRSPEVTMSKFLRVISGYFSVIEVIGSNVTLESALKTVDVFSVDIPKSAGIYTRGGCCGDAGGWISGWERSAIGQVRLIAFSEDY